MRPNISHVLLLFFLTAACGRAIPLKEESFDPDTLNAIAEANMEALEGEWIIEDDADRYYFRFYDKSYIAMVWQGDVLIVSDQGTILHRLPGQVLLHSNNDSCSANVNENMVVNFDPSNSSHSRLIMLNVSHTSRVEMTRTLGIQQSSFGNCLWDGTPDGGFSIK